jgi:UDP-2,4-diacetamido-2,4,6-trideoxy-beta-L-altropyranose hydrolase
MFTNKSEAKLRIAIRADASYVLGTGHVIRCLTLAKVFQSKGHSVTFFCKKHEGNLIKLIERNLFSAVPLNLEDLPLDSLSSENYNHFLGGSQINDSKQVTKNSIVPFDLFIVDHYGLDFEWENLIRSCCKKILVIDDLANRKHDADFLLDQNCYLDSSDRYLPLIGGHTIQLVGPRYALLREEFLECRQTLEKFENRIKRRKVVIFFGGVDQSNETLKAIQGLSTTDKNIKFSVILGENNPNKEQVISLCNRLANFTPSINVSDFAARLAGSMLYIGACGSTSLERSCCGLPSIVSSIALNQEEGAQHLHNIGALQYLGKSENCHPHDYREAFETLFNSNHSLMRMHEEAVKLVDGAGAKRVFDALLEENHHAI